MLQFREVFRNGLNWTKKMIFWFILHLMSTSQNFAKYRTLLRYISEVSFISVAYAVVKWKILKVFCIDSVSMKCPLFCDFLRPYSPKYCLILLKLWPLVVSNKKKTVFKKSFKILNFGSNGMQLKFTVSVHFGTQFLQKLDP